MEWETPKFTEIDMSAEIGSYQGEPEEQPWPQPEFIKPRSPVQVESDAKR